MRRFARFLAPPVLATLLAVGATLPAHAAHTSTLEGLDVSHWQGVIDWKQVADADYDFAFAKATDGRTFKDPGFGDNREGAEFLAKNGAIMIGADNLTLEQTPTADPLNFLPVHTYLLAEAGAPILEMAFLDELVEERVQEFAFFGACIKLRGATGAPMRPVAMPLAD